MNRVRRVQLGEEHTAILYDQIDSAGSVKYAFLVAVVENGKKEPIYYIASEVNQMAAVLGGGSHYLGVFDGSGHANLGAKNDWGNAHKFFREALRIAEEKFGEAIEEDPVEDKKPSAKRASKPAVKAWWQFWK